MKYVGLTIRPGVIVRVGGVEVKLSKPDQSRVRLVVGAPEGIKVERHPDPNWVEEDEEKRKALWTKRNATKDRDDPTL